MAFGPLGNFIVPDTNNSSANPGPGPNGHLGVTASYSGGVNGRAFEIDFYCDENANPGF